MVRRRRIRRHRQRLRERGVTFERYDLPGLTLDGDVHVADRFKAVWFEDDALAASRW